MIVFVPVRIFSEKRFYQKMLRYGIILYGKIIIFILGRILVKIDCREESIIETPVIYILNHRSSSDAFLLAGLTDEIVQVVNVWPLKLPVLGYFANLAGYLSVKEMAMDEFASRCGTLLDQGVSVAAFPEGTRSGTKQMGKFYGQPFRAAMQAKATVVPVCIMGNEDKPSRGSYIIQPGKIRIRRLKPIMWDEYKDMNAFVFKRYVWRIMDEYMKEVE
ncbi:MAG: 1-acyl-sn-glycerol-3-phosphate acyltransferase [Kiritimatiellae bacterium]|nr:1-acyl-sn-glycerol-3-phosphate acyltransferase [Kiritimatiellia bacterium]